MEQIKEAFGYGNWVAIVVLLVFFVGIPAYMGWIRKAAWSKAWKGAAIGMFVLTIIAALIMWHDAQP